MALLTSLPPPVESVAIPSRLSVSRMVSAGQCKLRPALPSPDENLFPSSPAAVWGRIVHSLFEHVLKGQVGQAEDPREAIERELHSLVDQADAKIAAGPFAFRLLRLQAAFSAIDWGRRWQAAVEDALSLQAQNTATSSRASKPSGKKFDLKAALALPGFSASEVPLPETNLRLTGRIDAIRTLPNRVVRITDYKTGSAFDEEGRLLAHIALQVNLYALVVAELLPRADIEIEVVTGEKTVRLFFDHSRKSETSQWLETQLEQLPAETGLSSSELASVGEQCRTCEFRHVCPLFRASIPELWNRTDNSFPLPLDIAGTILSVQPSDGDSITVKLKDLAGRIVKVHRLDRLNAGVPDLREGDNVWFFNLASIEPQAYAGAWRHPRNFHELPSSPTERRAWTLTVYLSHPASDADA